MKLTHLLIVLVLVSEVVFACSPDARPHFRIIAPDVDNCYFTSVGENLSSEINIIDYMAKKTNTYADCNKLILTEKEQEIFRSAINRLNKELYKFSLIYIEKQSDLQYAEFQKKMENVNSDGCDCKKYANVSREDEWTIYVETSDCPNDPSCAMIPPEGCASRIMYDLTSTNSLVPLIIIIVFITLLIALFFLLRRGRQIDETQIK